MTINIKKPLQIFYGTSPQVCHYLPLQMEKKIVTEISGNNSNELNNLLTMAGFRRSHKTAYRPACNFCNACIPVRINVSKYTPNRSQKRARKAALDLTCDERPPIATREQYDLFKDYQKLRHEESEMAAMDFNEYRSMIEDTTVDTLMFEFRDKNHALIAASLTDIVENGLSGVYKFFSPKRRRDSLGTWIIDWHVQKSLANNLQYVYLGYWISGCTKMSYKSNFSGLEKLVNNTLQSF
jgi:arginine-tRNA-protein transferase